MYYMPRPRKCRRIRWCGGVRYFKPQGIPMTSLTEVGLTMEEIEAVRLKDYLGVDQVQAARKMNTSQSTFQRILTSAHKKIAEGLIKGKALRIEKR